MSHNNGSIYKCALYKVNNLQKVLLPACNQKSVCGHEVKHGLMSKYVAEVNWLVVTVSNQ